LKLSTKGYFISLLNEPVDVLISETPTSDLEQVVEIACNLGWILLASEYITSFSLRNSKAKVTGTVPAAIP